MNFKHNKENTFTFDLILLCTTFFYHNKLLGDTYVPRCTKGLRACKTIRVGNKACNPNSSVMGTWSPDNSVEAHSRV